MLLITIHSYIPPMQLVVPSAVRKAVSAATNTFTTAPITFFFIIPYYFLHLTSSISHRLVSSEDTFVITGAAVAALL